MDRFQRQFQFAALARCKAADLVLQFGARGMAEPGRDVLFDHDSFGDSAAEFETSSQQ